MYPLNYNRGFGSSVLLYLFLKDNNWSKPFPLIGKIMFVFIWFLEELHTPSCVEIVLLSKILLTVNRESLKFLIKFEPKGFEKIGSTRAQYQVS